MKCFHCQNVICRTEYPEGLVISVCPRCDWRSSGIKIPDKIPSVQSISLVNQPKSNIFDQYYINNEVRVDSMSQKPWSLECNRDDCSDKDKYGTLIYSITCKVCYRNKLERMEKLEWLD